MTWLTVELDFCKVGELTPRLCMWGELTPRPVMPPPRIIYAGSVTVNEGNNRFFEPAPGRNWVIGVRAAQMF